MVNTKYARRNICLGLIDGTTIPLALAAALNSSANSNFTVIIACIAVAIAGAVMMSLSAYMEGMRYEPAHTSFGGAITIGVSYFIGGLLIVLPFIIIQNRNEALFCSAVLAGAVLFTAGYLDSIWNGANGWTGAARVLAIGMAAAGAAYFAGSLFAIHH